MNCLDYSKLVEFLGKHESILVLTLVLVTILSLIMFNNNPLYLFLVNVLLLIGYFVLSKRDDKKFMTHTLAWQKGNQIKVAYRPVHARTLTNDVQYFPPRERVY